ncbi:hypothetical protein DMN91_000873 [Ooceraea biroi]|uniref:Uncharacterized protein n=1 Tax=Ooceraea biroi TaxID=2015173 RepID=A0A3L8E2Z3_OOCBI|nr:uncharacterized protein LOC113562103 [Ooceraea biroi]RLU27074.1 hypothetical protein DMN91_000873 [Ooceraea biroi]
MYCVSIIFFSLCILRMIFADQSLLYLDEIRSLSELPMDKLIRIKSSFGSGNGITNENENENEEIASSRTIPVTLPMALPLKRSNNNKKPIRRYEDHYDEKGKDTKISKIFQLAVTALSFLAFGGYLLTLIISAIRRNNGNNGTNGNNVLIFSNLQTAQKYNRPKRNILIFDPMENNFETDKLYEGMIMLSRSYALYN